MEDGVEIKFGGGSTRIAGSSSVGALWLYGSESSYLYLSDSTVMFYTPQSKVQFGGSVLSEVNEPEESTDAATKGYVDNLVGQIGAMLDTIIGEVV